MLRGAITTTRLATITAIEHHLQSQFKILNPQCHQLKENNQFVTRALKAALTQLHRRARKITRVAEYCTTNFFHQFNF